MVLHYSITILAGFLVPFGFYYRISSFVHPGNVIDTVFAPFCKLFELLKALVKYCYGTPGQVQRGQEYLPIGRCSLHANATLGYPEDTTMYQLIPKEGEILDNLP